MWEACLGLVFDRLFRIFGRTIYPFEMVVLAGGTFAVGLAGVCVFFYFFLERGRLDECNQCCVIDRPVSEGSVSGKRSLYKSQPLKGKVKQLSNSWL